MKRAACGPRQRLSGITYSKKTISVDFVYGRPLDAPARDFARPPDGNCTSEKPFSSASQSSASDFGPPARKSESNLCPPARKSKGSVRESRTDPFNEFVSTINGGGGGNRTRVRKRTACGIYTISWIGWMSPTGLRFSRVSCRPVPKFSRRSPARWLTAIPLSYALFGPAGWAGKTLAVLRRLRQADCQLLFLFPPFYESRVSVCIRSPTTSVESSSPPSCGSEVMIA